MILELDLPNLIKDIIYKYYYLHYKKKFLNDIKNKNHIIYLRKIKLQKTTLSFNHPVKELLMAHYGN